MVYVADALYPHMTVAENMGFALKLQRVPKDERNTKVGRAAELLDLERYLDRKPRRSPAANANASPWDERSSANRVCS